VVRGTVLNGSRRVVISIVHGSFLGFDFVKQLVTASITCNLPPQSRLIGHCPFTVVQMRRNIDFHTADPKVSGEKIVNNFVTSCQTKETQKKITISEPNKILPEPFNIFPEQPVTVVPMPRTNLGQIDTSDYDAVRAQHSCEFAFALADKSVTSLDIV
jgi:hypothetical protein